MYKNTKKVNIFSIIIAIVWTLVVLISLFYNITNITKQQHNLALEHAKNAFEKDLMFRKWVAMHGGVYVFPSKKTPPNPYLADIPNRDLTTTTGAKLTLMNPAYTLRELMDNFSGMYGEKGHITSLKLLNPNNKPDEWEKKVLKGFNTKQFTQFYEIFNYNGDENLRYMRALIVKPSCLKCHVKQGYKVGDTRGGVSITIPMKKYNNDGKLEKKVMIYSYLLILIISYIIGIIIYKRIISTLNKEYEAENKLHHQEKILTEQAKMASMGEMIGNISHQWRQPLSVISTASTGMMMQKEFGTLNDEQFKKSCEAINNQAQYLSKTIDDFKNFIKGDREKKVFKLSDDIESFLNLVEGSVKSNNIKIILNLQEDIKIDGYENELTQCFINIFNNAKDILKEKNIEKKLLFIKTQKKENKIIISFKDNAGGIAEDVLHKVFEPYFTTKHKSQGTGLGLHMTYNIIVDGMNGTIEASNVEYMYEDKKYNGAKFRITLPI